MENYYQKYKLSSLYFGAYHSGNQYFFPSNKLSELEFNRYNNPYYIDFIDLPKTGVISLFNYLEPVYTKSNISGSDKIYSLPQRTDTLNVNLEKIKKVYAEKNKLKNLNTIINYFGNNLSFVLSGANLNNNEWSNEEDLSLLINKLNLSYSGNIDYENGFRDFGGFYGRGYLLQNCFGCVDNIQLTKISGSNASLNCQDCLLNQQYDVIKFSINLEYNIYNLLSENNKSISLNSEKIKSSDLSKVNFITFNVNDKDLQDAFSLTTSTKDGEFYKDKNYLPLFFRNLNLNSKKLVPFVSDEYSNDYILNQSGYKITSYKYVPNITSQKVFGSRIVDENSILYPKNISINSYSKNIYDALFSGNEAYEYKVKNDSYIPEVEQVQENYFKYLDVCANYHLIPRRPVAIRLSPLTGIQFYLYGNLSSGANLGYSISINGSGNTALVTAPNATLNNIKNIGLTFVITGSKNNWGRAAKLTGWDSAENDRFGFSSCINKEGNIFAIGAPNANINNISGAGAVYIFTGKNENWYGIAKITGSSSYSGYKFGSSLSMNAAGNVLIAGAPKANNYFGLAYIFTGNGNNWKEHAKINKKIWNYPNETSGYFGYSVCMNNSGNLVAIGSPNENISGGLVYIYTGDSYNDKNWNYADSINNSNFFNTKSGDYFGYSLDLNSGNILAVGAPGFNKNSGLCSIFNLNLGNITKIADLKGQYNSGSFGSSVALNFLGNVLVVGSPFVSMSGNITIRNAGLSTAFINKTGWELYSTRSNFLNYEYLGTSVSINDTGDVIILGAIGTTSANGNVNAGNYYISSRDQTCPDFKLLNENPIENYTIPNIKIQLDAMDRYSLNENPAITYWKNKVNFGEGYNNLYNSGDAITINSNIQVIDLGSTPSSGILFYNNPQPGDSITFNTTKFTHSIDFFEISQLNDLINNTFQNSYKIKSNIINNNNLLIFNSGSSFEKGQSQGLEIKTNYLSGNKQAFSFYHYKTFDPDQIINLQKQSNNIKNLYNCRHSKIGEIDDSYRDVQLFSEQNKQKEYILAILNNGKITGFGTNESGRLIGSLTSDDIFSGDWNSTPVGQITGAIKLSLGPDFAIALLDNQTITGWGNNFSGKALNGNNLTGVIDISAGGNHSLALLANNKITGWGDNTYNQAFGGNNLTGIIQISAGWLHSLALNNTGKITGWGLDDYGQASFGNNLTGIKEISAGKFHSLAIFNNQNRITGWGDDYCNQLAQIHNITSSNNIKFTNISQISFKKDAVLMLTSNAIIIGTGSDENGKISLGSNLTGVIKIASGPNHSIAILSGNKITGWGLDDYGQASSGNNLTGVIDISLGDSYTLALLENNKITGWGFDAYGQATRGNNLTGVSGISAGYEHSLALLKNGTVTGWGYNTNNQASGGNNLTGVIKIEAGYSYSLALLNNQTITGWGLDDYGQTSSGNNLTGVIDISAGYEHSLALLKNGTVTGWGHNILTSTTGGNSLTGVKKIQAGTHASVALLQNNQVTGWGDEDIINNLFNITINKQLGPTGLSGISAGLFSSYAFVNNNQKITGYGFNQLNINLLNDDSNSYINQVKNLEKYNFAHGVNSLNFIIKNPNSGSMILSSQKDISLNDIFAPISPYTDGMKASNLYTSSNLQSGKYLFSLTGSGFYNALDNYPNDSTLLPKYQTDVMLSAYFTSFSTMIITGYNGKLPISIFFVEYGLLNSDQKTIQSYNNTGCYISTLNTGKLINLNGIGNPIKVNEPFYSDVQVGNLIMDTGRFEYYINNRLIYTGSTGFNFGQIVLGNNYQYTGTQPVTTYSGYLSNVQLSDLTGIQKGFNGNLFEVLIYDSALNGLNRNEVFYYLTNKWQTIANYYPSSTIALTNRIIYSEKTKTNCSDCSTLLNSLPKQNEPHILLFEYNFYGYTGTSILDCDLDMNVYILKTGFYEQSRKEPLVSNLDIAYVTGSQKSISTINAKSQNVYNIADFNFDYNSIPPSQDRLKILKSELKLQQPVRTYFTGEYLKYPKIYGIGL